MRVLKKLQQHHHRWFFLLCISCWVLMYPIVRVSEGCVEVERRGLLQLRDSLYSPRPVNESEWSWAGRDCCQWDGVTCREESPAGRVVGISFASRRPPELGGWSLNGSLLAPFTYLQDLSLVGNQLTGWVSSPNGGIPSLVNLKSLYLSTNRLTDKSIHGIYNITSLTEVDLSNNVLTDSTILKGFCQLKNLASLNLGGNMIEGNIDPCVGNLYNLQDLSLFENRFSGNIPPIFSNLTSMRTIHFSGNQFTGLFPFSTLSNLTNLSFINLNKNCQLEVETENLTWVPSFQLETLYLICCKLNKRGNGSGIPSFLSTQKKLSYLDLSFTSIQGSIPPWLFYNVDYSMWLIGNNLSGPFPQLLHPNETIQLQILDISDNHVSGPLPKNMSSLFPSLILLNISKNSFHGSTLSSFGELAFLEVLDLSDNGLHGEIPQSLTGSGTKLKHLRLSNNLLKGNMLPRDSNMTDLHYLHLYGNQLTGEISPDLLNSPLLVTLDLRQNLMSGRIPSLLSDLLELDSILLSRNHFEGRIPVEFCRMQRLKLLDLSDNSLSGTIPSCLNNLTLWREESSNNGNPGDSTGEPITVDFNTKGKSYSYSGKPLWLMTGIDLSMNGLSGSIPVELGDLRAIQSLNLSYNHLSGHIPASIKGLAKIESLDLSHNQLVGNIPSEIVQLTSLSTFSVASNNLYGAIPFDSQFSTFTKSSFDGNPGLCGQLLQRKCPTSDVPSRANDAGGGDDGSEEGSTRVVDNPWIYYGFIAGSCAVGFWGFMGALALNMDLRAKYFTVVDEWTDPLVGKVVRFKSKLRNCLR